MAYINAMSRVVPSCRLSQERVVELGREVLKGKTPFIGQALQIFVNAGVRQRRLVTDVEQIMAEPELKWRNDRYIEASIRLAESLVENLLIQADLQADRIDQIITTSCTGFMIPALDAHLINRFRMRPDIKRIPITELGCAAGAMALSRANDYLRAYPDQRVLVLALELPSLTYQFEDLRAANLVSAALFGDGGAAVLMSNDPGQCEIRSTRTHFFYDTPHLMGFDLGSSGFKIILDKGIPDLIDARFTQLIQDFLQGLTTEQVRYFVFHPGGRKIMDQLASALELSEHHLRHSRQVLRDAGNLSSASILWVLAETLAAARDDGPAVMCAFGPGFNAELILGHIHADRSTPQSEIAVVDALAT